MAEQAVFSDLLSLGDPVQLIADEYWNNRQTCPVSECSMNSDSDDGHDKYV